MRSRLEGMRVLAATCVAVMLVTTGASAGSNTRNLGETDMTAVKRAAPPDDRALDPKGAYRKILDGFTREDPATVAKFVLAEKLRRYRTYGVMASELVLRSDPRARLAA